MNVCSGPIWAGCVPAPRPMNQRTTVPPFGPGPAAIGAGVMLTVDGEGASVTAAWDGAWLAATLGDAVEPPQADAMIATTPTKPTKAFGMDLRAFMVCSIPPLRDLV